MMSPSQEASCFTVFYNVICPVKTVLVLEQAARISAHQLRAKDWQLLLIENYNVPSRVKNINQ